MHACILGQINICHILLFSVSGKQPPRMIMYDVKKTVAQMSQKSSF